MDVSPLLIVEDDCPTINSLALSQVAVVLSSQKAVAITTDNALDVASDLLAPVLSNS